MGGHFHKDNILWFIKVSTLVFLFNGQNNLHIKKCFDKRFTLWLNSEKGCWEYDSILYHIYSSLISSVSVAHCINSLITGICEAEPSCQDSAEAGRLGEGSLTRLVRVLPFPFSY